MAKSDKYFKRNGRVFKFDNTPVRNSSNENVKRTKFFPKRHYDDDLDENSVDSIDAFWTNFARVRTPRSRESLEKDCSMIRSIRERVVRGYVHDEVQLNDGKIVSQLYSQYIKETKSLLMDYLDPKHSRDTCRKGWFLNDVNETGREFAQFLSSRWQARKPENPVPGKSSSYRSKASAQIENSPVNVKKNVRFNTPSSYIENLSSIEDEPGLNDTGSQYNLETAEECSINTSLTVVALANHVNIPRSTHSSQARLHPIAENGQDNFTKTASTNAIDKNPMKKELREKDPASSGEINSPLGFTQLQRQQASNTAFVKAFVVKKLPNKLSASNFNASHKRKNSSTIQRSGDGHESAVGQVKSNLIGTWSKSVRLLRGVKFVTVLDKVDKKKEELQAPGLLGILPISAMPRRLSETPESCGSGSPSNLQKHDFKSKRSTGRKTLLPPTKAVRKSSMAEGSERRNVTSPKKFAREKCHYGSLGVGKVAEVTTVSSYVRYQFDMPDDLDDSLEHLRLHGYLKS